MESTEFKIPRLVMLADMGNEPDEEQQNTHLLLYSNELQIEGLIAITGKFLHPNHQDPFKRVVHPELFLKLIDGFEKVLANLKQHATGWPEPDYLRSIVKSGQPGYGADGIGKGMSSEGSEHIIKVLEDPNPEPVNFIINAGSNTLAQAILDLNDKYKDDRDTFVKLLNKIHVFENGAQDDCGAWITHHYPEVIWMRSNYQTYAYMGKDNILDPGGAGPYTWEPFPNTYEGQGQWADEHIRFNHGPLGELYPHRVFLEGGGTIPFLRLVNKGLSRPEPEYRTWGGWGGRFTEEKLVNYWSKHNDVKKLEHNSKPFALYSDRVWDKWTDPVYKDTYYDCLAPVYRWRRHMLQNFQGRMDWCVKPFAEANHNPIAVFEEDESFNFIYKTVAPGCTLSLNASKSYDPDGDEIEFDWYIYTESGTYSKPISINHSNAPVASLDIPEDAAGRRIHVILQINDIKSDNISRKTPSMYAYRRIVIDVTGTPVNLPPVVTMTSPLDKHKFMQDTELGEC